MSTVTYFMTFIEGILTFISPCILPMLPIYFVYLSGTTSENSVAASSQGNKLLLNSIGFVLGFTIIFVLLGATVTSLGQFFSDHRELLQKISGVVMVLFSLNFMGVFKISLLNKEKRFQFEFKKLGFFTSIIFGIAFGFGWTPCLGAFLGSALALASNSRTMTDGMLLLLLYSIGLGIPFILTSLVFERAREAFKIIQKYNRIISIVSGILLITAGILVFTDSLKYIGS